MFLIADAGNDNHWCLGIFLPHVAEQFEPAQPRHRDVRENNVVTIHFQSRQSLFCRLRRLTKMMFGQQFVERVTDCFVIVEPQESETLDSSHVSSKSLGQHSSNVRNWCFNLVRFNWD